jgi:hypothetical protein
MRSMSLGGIFCTLGSQVEVQKSRDIQRVYLIAAMASLKVNLDLVYQEALLGWASGPKTVGAHKVTKEYRPRRAGVVRAMARSDHCRWLSTPR